MKCLLLYPPQWIAFNPHLAIPALQGFLQNNDCDVSSRDLNIEFYNRILTPEFMAQSIEKSFKFYNENITEKIGRAHV